MKHAIYVPPTGELGDAHALAELGCAAEQSGWDGFFLWEHVMYDAWVALSAIAARTSKIRLGPMVTPLARHRPWNVAREAVTLDHLSDGRVILGVGLGIDCWQDLSAFGELSDGDAERARLVDDGIDILWRLWSGKPVSYEGQSLSIHDACFLPSPVQQPRIPTWSAMGWPAPNPGPFRQAARCDGVMPLKLEPFTPDEADRLVRQITAQRTTDAPFDVCVWGAGERSADFEAAGVTWLLPSFILPDVPLADVRRQIAAGPPQG